MTSTQITTIIMTTIFAIIPFILISLGFVFFHKSKKQDYDKKEKYETAVNVLQCTGMFAFIPAITTFLLSVIGYNDFCGYAYSLSNDKETFVIGYAQETYLIEDYYVFFEEENGHKKVVKLIVKDTRIIEVDNVVPYYIHIKNQWEWDNHYELYVPKKSLIVEI